MRQVVARNVAPVLRRRREEPVDDLARAGHGGVKLSQEETDKIACWIDLLVPFCGDYLEANTWSKGDLQAYAHFLDKRRQMEQVEQRNIQESIRSEKKRQSDESISISVFRGCFSPASRPGAFFLCRGAVAAAAGFLGPDAVAASKDRRTVYVTCKDTHRASFGGVADGKVVGRTALPAEPTGIALNPAGNRLYVTCSEGPAAVCIVETASGKIAATMP